MASVSAQMKKRVEALNKAVLSRPEPAFIVCIGFREGPVIGYSLNHKIRGKVRIDKTDTETQSEFEARVLKEAKQGGFGHVANGKRHITLSEEKGPDNSWREQVASVDLEVTPTVKVTSYDIDGPVPLVDRPPLEGQEYIAKEPPVRVGSVRPKERVIPVPPQAKESVSQIKIMQQIAAATPDWQMM